MKDGYVEGIAQMVQSICANPKSRAYVKKKHDIFVLTIMKNFRSKSSYYHNVDELIALDTCFYDLYA